MSEELVGPVVGPQSSSDAASTVGWTENGEAWSCAIGGIPFMKAVSDERPYARETADYRKEQVDQQRTVGDQSLSGFWTRGQLSFHRGAGITYYEVLDGETVLDRFSDARGVDTWEPGEVTVRPTATEINSTDTRDAVLFDGGLAILTAAGLVRKVTYAGVDSALALTAAGTSTSITTDGVNLYATNGDKIDKAAPGGAFATLFTHPTPKNWAHVWWAKDRLWMMDEDGDLFVESPAGTLAIGDLIWSSGYPDTAWSLVDSEGAVFIAARDTIWAVSIDSQTTTPVLGAPVVVAKVGAQETIGCLGNYLGHLIVASSAGVRVARIGEGLLLGDLIIEADATNCARMAYRKSVAVVTAGRVQYEVDLLENVADLTPAFAPVRDLGTPASKHGSLVLPDGRVGFFSSEGLSLEDADLESATGYITTGFHRFGTLELKDFRTVSVFARGTSGTVSVTLIRRDGAEYNLLTLAPANFGSNEISLNLPSVTDYIGFKFTILADEDGVAPTLLGYQLRGMPAPSRHRFIQVPLSCFDVEQVGSVERGQRGDAWRRLSALEELERASGVVKWQDFDTGEVAQVLIERVQFQGKTPSLSDKSGFGGFIMLTMRKVA